MVGPLPRPAVREEHNVFLVWYMIAREVNRQLWVPCSRRCSVVSASAQAVVAAAVSG